MDLLSLYLHIPFCSTKCTYCAFNTYTGLESLVEPFIEALIGELNILGQSNPGHQVGTVFFGGGTPSLLTANQFSRIVEAIHRNFSLTSEIETTLESNPNDLSLDYLRDLRRLGFNRISIGMQSATPRDLQLFDRRHDTEMVVQAVEAGYAAGFENINLDLIYGIPYQTLDEWRATLEQAVALNPTHFSLYCLELKGGTPLRENVEVGQVQRPDDDLAADMYELASDFLTGSGYDQYEISNWCRAGLQSRHNLQYWRNLPYLGLGPGAHGFAGGVRYSTMILPQRYIDAMKQASGQYDFPRTPTTAKAIRVDQATEIAETLMMGLRLTQEGIQRPAFRERFGVDLVDMHRQVIEKYEKLGLLHVDEQVVCLTERGRFLSNTVISELI